MKAHGAVLSVHTEFLYSSFPEFLIFCLCLHDAIIFCFHHSEAQRRERLRQAALASAGQKNLKGRVQAKKLRAKEQMMGARKHEEAMKEMARRKAENLKKGVPGAARNARLQQQQRSNARAPAAKGASSGVRNKNRHLQDFEQMKNSHKKRRGMFVMLIH